MKSKKMKDEEDDKTDDVKKKTKKEIAAIIAETKKEVKYLITLPPFDYTNISPAPALGNMSTKNLCSYVFDKCPRVQAVAQFSTCTPTVAVVMGICNLLLPLANAGSRNLIPADRVLLKSLKKQLKQNFTTMIKSVGTLSNGNAPLFALSGVANKNAGKSHDGQLDACKFRLDTTRGRGVVYVISEGMDYAKNFTVYYGPGNEYDSKTWIAQNGGAKQFVRGLTPGVQYGFVIVANGKVLQGLWAEVQTRNAPFN